MSYSRQKLEQLLARIQEREGMWDTDALSIITLTRQLLEVCKKKKIYPVLNFYCNWCLHVELTQSSVLYDMLAQITDVFLRDNTNYVVEVSQLISMEKLRREFIDLYSSEALAIFLFTDLLNWRRFGGQILKNIINKPIKFPPDVEKGKRGKSKAGRIYAGMQQKAACHPGLLARKLWLSDDVKGERKGDVYWIVETKPNMRVRGRFLMTEAEASFERR